MPEVFRGLSFAVALSAGVVGCGSGQGPSRSDALGPSDASGLGEALGSGSEAGTLPEASALLDAGPNGPTHGPLKPSMSGHFLTDSSGKAVALAGSQTWNTMQDLGLTGSPAPVDFGAFVQFLGRFGHNATILWKKDLPTYCGWGAGGTWHIAGPWPWPRTGAGQASDGLPKFDLTTFDASYFQRLRSRVVALQQAGVYTVVELFDGLQLTGNRCGTSSPDGDAFPLTGVNNVNGIDDGYSGGSSGTGSMTMTSNNAITDVEDTFVRMAIDTLNDLDNVLWEVSEEGPTGSDWWQEHTIGLIHAYEKGGTFEGKTYPGKPLQHPVGRVSTQYPGDDAPLYTSAADWVAPMQSSIAPASNQGKAIVNDSDHSYYFTSFVDGSGTVNTANVHHFVWENFTSGASVLFMDPYIIDWTSGNRNLCAGASDGVCTSPDSKYDDFRKNLGYVAAYGNKMNLVAMTPQPSLCSTGHCLAETTGQGEYLVYDEGGSLDVTLVAGTFTVEWLDPSTGNIIAGSSVSGGGQTTFTVPSGLNDAVLYLKGQ
jgi:hypothetical protein